MRERHLTGKKTTHKQNLKTHLDGILLLHRVEYISSPHKQKSIIFLARKRIHTLKIFNKKHKNISPYTMCVVCIYMANFCSRTFISNIFGSHKK